MEQGAEGHCSSETMSDSEKDKVAPRPRRRRKQARPGEIIEAGLLEFGESGFAATRLEDVAKRAGIAKGTIYLYFDSKEALFEAAVRSRLGPVLDEASALIGAFPGPTLDLIRMLVPIIYAKLVDSDARILVRIILSEGVRFPAITELYYREVVSKGRAFLARIVERGVARGEFRAGPLTDLPIVLLAPVLMAALWKMTFDRYDPIATERFLAAHLDLLVNGLVKRE
jgi:AcrR family transcriptional regulator